MKKSRIAWLVLDSIFLVLFNVIFFVTAGCTHPKSVWVSYAFIHFAYLIVLLTPRLTPKTDHPAPLQGTLIGISIAYFMIEFIVGTLLITVPIIKLKIDINQALSFPIFSIGTLKKLIEYLLGLVLIYLHDDNFHAVLCIQIALACIYLFIFAGALISTRHTIEQEHKQKIEINFIKAACTVLQTLMNDCPDEKSRKQVEKAYDILHSSPTASNQRIANLEIAIKERLKVLSATVDSGSSENIIIASDNLIKKIKERNNELRIIN